MGDAITLLAILALVLVIGIRIGFRAARGWEPVQRCMTNELDAIDYDRIERGEFR